MPYIIDDEGDVIAHFGVLGMKWGVRKSESSGGGNSGGSSSNSSFKSDADWEKHVYSSKTYKSVYNKAAETMNKGHLDKINKKWEGKDLSKDENFKPYMKEVASTFQRIGNQELSKQLGGNTTNPSGTQRVGFVFSESTGFGAIIPEDVKHADDFSNLGVKVVFDPKTKFVIRVEAFDNSLAQSALTEEDVLAHYGVLGMKWGVRRNERAAGMHRTKAAVYKKLGLSKQASGHNSAASAHEKQAGKTQSAIDKKKAKADADWEAKQKKESKAFVEELMKDYDAAMARSGKPYSKSERAKDLADAEKVAKQIVDTMRKQRKVRNSIIGAGQDAVTWFFLGSKPKK